MARSWPKCFLAAWVMAFCSVSTRTERSMPLSFATWSRIMFRLTMGACGAGEAIGSSLSLCGPCGPYLVVEIRFYVCLADLRVRNAKHLAVHVHHHQTLLEPEQLPDERLAVVGLRDGGVGLHPHPLAGVLLEMPGRAQRPVET